MKRFTFKFMPDITQDTNYAGTGDTFVKAASDLLSNIEDAPPEIFLKLWQFAESYMDMSTPITFTQFFEIEPSIVSSLKFISYEV